MHHRNFLDHCLPLIAVLSFVLTSTAFGGWTTPTNISNDRGWFAVDPHIVFDSNGHAHMAYENFHDNVGGVWYTNTVNGSWSTPVKLVETGGSFGGPGIVITPDEVIHIFYSVDGQYEITKPVSGGNWSAPQRYDELHKGGHFAGAVVLENGAIYVTWLRLFADNPTPRNALWGRYKPLGGDWGPEELVQEGTSDSNWPGGAWLKARGNKVYCTYDMSNAGWYKIRYENGTWSNSVYLAAEAGGLRLAWSPDGSEMAAAYAYDVDGNADGQWFEVFVRFSYDGGQNWTPEYNVSNKVALDRAIEFTYDPAGNLHVVWEDFACDGCKADISYRPRINGIWQPKQNISNTYDGRSGLPQNAIQAYNDTLWLSYSDNPIDGYEDIYVSYNHLNLAPQPPGPVTSFTIQPGDKENLLSWTNPTSGFYTGTMIRYSTTGHPATPQDGTLLVDKEASSGTTDGYTHTGLTNSTTYYYTAFAHSWHPEYASGVNASGTPHMAIDFDADLDIDQSDFAVFQRCITGNAITPPPAGCESSDLDNDQDVDIYDVAKFDLCATAPAIPADEACLNLPVEDMLPDWPHTPYPADGATEIPSTLTMSWSAGTGADSHNVYFGPSNPPAFQVNQTGTTFNPGTLSDGVTYYWRIDEVNTLGVTTGPLWSFTTDIEPVTNLNRYVLTNFNTGDKYYLDREYIITSMPSSLEGVLGIKTNNDDRYMTTTSWLTFDLNVQADVYIAYDHRGDPVYGGQLPQWLSDNFTDTGLTITVDDTYASPFKLYVRNYNPTHVVLGGNLASPATGTNSNYFVLVKPTGQ